MSAALLECRPRTVAAAWALGAAVIALLAPPATARDFDLNPQVGLIAETVEMLARYDGRKAYGIVGVTERTRPEFDPDGLRIGNFLLFPSLETTLVLDDNLYRQKANLHEDVRTEVAPRIRVVSQLPRHAIRLDMGLRDVRHRLNPQSDYLAGFFDLRTALHIDHAHTLSFAAVSEISRVDAIDPDDPKAAREPIAVRRDLVTAGLTRDAGRLYGTASASLERWDYSDVPAFDGTLIDQDVRDTLVIATQVFAGLRLSPGYELRARLRALRQIDEGHGTVNRTATGYEAMAGVAFETTPMWSWYLLGGYGVRDFDTAGLPTIDAMLLEMQWRWYVMQRLTLSGSLRREFVEQVPALGNGRIDVILRSRLDYELAHNLVLNASGAWRNAQPMGTDEITTTQSLRLGLDYYLSKSWLLQAAAETTWVTSTEDREYARNRIWMGVTVRR